MCTTRKEKVFDLAGFEPITSRILILIVHRFHQKNTCIKKSTRSGAIKIHLQLRDL